MIGSDEHFISKSRWEFGCRVWNGPFIGAGYGAYYADGGFAYAHRWVWERAYGSIPDGMVIDHICGNRACVNLSHLRAVTQRENLLAGDTVNARNAAKDECEHGHPFDETNTYMWRGKRHCRRCRADAAQRLRDRRKVLA
jgi:hypothetical protein